MKRYPFTFTDAMIRAIRDGRKTQDRRVIGGYDGTWSIEADDDGAFWPGGGDEMGDWQKFPSPFGSPGDRFWLPECFVSGWPVDAGDIQQYDELGNQLPEHVWYRATQVDGEWVSDRGAVMAEWCDDDGSMSHRIPWRSSTSMPRRHSRTIVEIVSIRVERVQDISINDAIAEGVWLDPPDAHGFRSEVRQAFRELWDERNTWDENPWVWVPTFRLVEGTDAQAT
jgi:hypothetical protein